MSLPSTPPGSPTNKTPTNTPPGQAQAAGAGQANPAVSGYQQAFDAYVAGSSHQEYAAGGGNQLPDASTGPSGSSGQKRSWYRGAHAVQYTPRLVAGHNAAEEPQSGAVQYPRDPEEPKEKKPKVEQQSANRPSRKNKKGSSHASQQRRRK